MIDKYVETLQPIAYDLFGVTPIDLWGYMPGELDIMMLAVKTRLEREDIKQDIRTARICLYLNLPYRKEGEMVSIREFMPGYDPDADKPEQTPQDMESMIELINTVFQGETK